MTTVQATAVHDKPDAVEHEPRGLLGGQLVPGVLQERIRVLEIGPRLSGGRELFDPSC